MAGLPKLGLSLALVLLCPALAGCLGTEVFAAEERDGCLGLFPMWVAFEQPGAWSSFPEDGQHGPWTVRTHALEGWLPFQDDGLDARIGPGNYSLGAISWVAPGASGQEDHEDEGGLTVWGPHTGEFRLDRRLSVTATFPAEIPLDQVGEHAATFLSEVSAADPDQQEAWVEAFLQDRTGAAIYPASWAGELPERGHRFHVDISGPLRTDQVVDPINLEAATEEMVAGSLRAEQGPWALEVQLATRSGELPRGGGPVRDVQVYPLDRVMVNIWQAPPDEASLERVLNGTLERLGLGSTEGIVGKPVVHPDCQHRFGGYTRTL